MDKPRVGVFQNQIRLDIFGSFMEVQCLPFVKQAISA